MASKLNFKDDQQQAIEHQGDLVLTASAGTGKTTILVEKFANTLIAEARLKKSPGVIVNLVAITFTDMAAAELKSRIRERLFDEINSGSTEPELKDCLNRIVRDLDSAYIGTIHSFCKRILIENFLEAEINPAFAILDEQDAEELQNISAEKALIASLTDKENILSPLVAASGLNSFRKEIINLANKLRCDGFVDIVPDELLQQYRSNWPDPQPVLQQTHDLIEEIFSQLSSFNASSGTDTTLKMQQDTSEALQLIKNLLENPNALFSQDLPELLTSTRSSPMPRNKALAHLKEISSEIRELTGKNSTDKPSLSDLANLNSTLPMVEETLKITSSYIEIYNKEKNRIDSFDFEDLLLKTRDLLKTKTNVIEHYHQKFKYLFVDEFQDVNALQMEIVQLLRGFQANNNSSSLFIVGDAKQSIYKFRSADVLRFENFIADVGKSGGKNLQLKSNFRSTPKLISTFNSLFEQLFKKEKENKYQTGYQHLEPGLASEDSADTRVEFIEMTQNADRHEAQIIARKISKMLQGHENITPGDIAVLMRTTTKLASIETEFKRANIPYRVIKGRGFYLQREIWDLAVYLKCLWFPEDNHASTALLRSPLCGISDETLLHLADNEILTSSELFCEKTIDFLTDPGEKQRFQLIGNLLQRHRSSLDTLSSAEIISQLLDVSGYEAFLLATVGGDQSAANVRKLIELSRNFESKGVESGLEFTLDLYGRIFSDKMENQAPVVGNDQGSVKIMTVHKSKGLQFPVVFLPYTHSPLASYKELMLYDNKLGIGMKVYNPETGKKDQSPYYNLVKKNLSSQDDAELLRLFYVAATRAKKHLILTAKTESKGNSWKKRLENIGLGEAEFQEKYSVSCSSDADIHYIPDAAIPLLEKLNKTEKSENRQALENIISKAETKAEVKEQRINCSVWDLIHLVYPQKQIPEYNSQLFSTNENIKAEDQETQLTVTETGTAIHEFLEHLDFSILPDPDQLINLLQKTPLSHEQQAEAAIHLQQWFSTSLINKLGHVAKLRRETPFSLKLEKPGVTVILNGIIDLVAEFPDGCYWLVDYKYAFSKESEEYQLQMMLYSMVLKKAFGKLPQSCFLAYLKDGKNIEVKIDEAELAKAEDKIWSVLSPSGRNGLASDAELPEGQISLF